MSDVDSFDKVVTYLGAVTRKPFVYKDKRYTPQTLRVSPGIFRAYTCPAGCGGCCSTRFSLDYLPFEERPYAMEMREIVIGRKSHWIYSDMQEDRKGERFCRNLIMRNGRCGVHGMNPFSCDFELLRFHLSPDGKRPNQFTTRLYGRGWNMLRIDGERGAMCEMQGITDESRADVLRKLGRLKQWAEFFELSHKVNRIIAWAESGDTSQPLIV